MKRHIPYPFTAIVGQEEMKRALILNLINPRLGGVLIRGEKGTAKSTAVRALAEVLPLRREVESCPYSCDPDQDMYWCDACWADLQPKRVTERHMRVINLPVSATEDRVVGALDMEHAIKKGEKRFEPGILAQANRNILYVDEINLLEDHLVDLLLDAAAMGVNLVEREGISHAHPSRFVLIGTMNPEEGDLRPQLLDRFGLVVDIAAEDDVDRRVEVVRRRVEYEENPEGFAERYRPGQEALGARIEAAQGRLRTVSYSDEVLRRIAELSVKLDVDGHRADITMLKTAVTNAAFCARDSVTDEDVRMAARLALPHRLRKRPFDDARSGTDTIRALLEEQP